MRHPGVKDYVFWWSLGGFGNEWAEGSSGFEIGGVCSKILFTGYIIVQKLFSPS